MQDERRRVVRREREGVGEGGAVQLQRGARVIGRDVQDRRVGLRPVRQQYGPSRRPTQTHRPEGEGGHVVGEQLRLGDT